METPFLLAAVIVVSLVLWLRSLSHRKVSGELKKRYDDL